ncbi:MAG: hypothetical protein H0Z24_03425 [Thermosipho sp. (in: Bacteria)]|nr:hypothetical protein [Thermosipho sp. (in: thermotogales)]
MPVTTREIVAVIAVVAVTALVKEFLLPKLKKSNKKSSKQVIKLAKEQGISYEEAAEKLITSKIAEFYKVSETVATFNSQVVNQGDRIAFNCDELGFITGEFIGLKKSKALGYTKHFVIKTSSGKIIAAPVELIDEDTVTVYSR